MADYFIFPKPRSIKTETSRFDFSLSKWIFVDPQFSQIFKQHAISFTEEINNAFPAPLTVTAGNIESGAILLRILKTTAIMGPEAYTLSIRKEGISIEACGESGAFYGLQTLKQIIDQAGCRINSLTIKDSPDFPNRGFMLDISRCKVPTMETLYWYADTLAMLKINQLQLYTEHTFAFSGHETVWHDASPMTADQILVYDKYCKDRCIELVPNFNSFGHFDRWLRHPEYFHLAESPNGFKWPWGNARSAWGWVLKPNQTTIEFLDKLYSEMLPNFSSKQLNVGCDETFELGTGWSKPLCEKRGKNVVYFDFLKKIHSLTQKHSRKMMFWGDIILHEPSLIRKLPKDVIAMNWGYDADHPFDKEGRIFSKSGIPYYVCPGTSSWRSITALTRNAIGNCSSAAKNGLRHGAVGYLNTDWGDEGHHQYLPTSYTGILAGAAFSWCGSANATIDFVEALNRLMFKDKSRTTGRLFYKLGCVTDNVPKLANFGGTTIYNHFLFRDKPLENLDPKLTVHHLKKCIGAFDSLESSIGNARPEVADGDIVKAELVNAIAMARCGCERGLLLMKDKSAKTVKEIRRDLEQVIRMHETLWLARNRIGGLRESSDYLRKRWANIE